MSAKLKLRADTLSCFFYFLMVGVYYALFTSRLPAIKAETGIGDAEVGISLLTLGIASVTGLVFCSRLIERFTSRRLLQVSSVALCLIVPFAGLAPNAVTLYIVTACLGLAVAIWDVCMNAQALLLEIETHGRYMGKMQAGYSFGCILGALVGALFAYFALSPFVTFLAFSLTTLFFWSFAFRHLKDDLPRQKTEKRGRMPLFIYFCGLLEILAFTGEGSIGDWGSIFLHSAKGATEATAALSFGVCALAMTLVRTQSDSLREKIGDQKLIGGGALLAAAGFLLSIFVSNPWVCLVGFAMIGAGIASAVPVIMSRAGTYPGVDPGAACATVSTLGYGTLLFIPPLLGSVAEHVGLDTAFFIPFTMALLLFAGSFALKPRN